MTKEKIVELSFVKMK